MDTERRRLLACLTGGGLLLGGCDRLARTSLFGNAVASARQLTFASQRLIIGREALAREFTRGDISPNFRANGSIAVDDPIYRRHAAMQFSQWQLRVDGMMANPLLLSLESLRAMPARSQITRHDCVEGWSAIAEWTGVPLADILTRARLLPGARYIVFHCADRLNGIPYYESIDLVDAFHPQTILAYRMNGQPLPIRYGAPIRLRVERQLGYKHAKYVRRIEAVASLEDIAGGKGGYWEDRRDYDWYAGI